MTPALPRRIALIGPGLIGGSLILALRAAGLHLEVTAYDRNPDHAQEACRVGIADCVAQTAAEAVSAAQLVLFGVPVGALPGLLRELQAHLPADAILTDVGSTKQGVIAAARGILGQGFRRFVPGHPISGAEKSGPGAAQAGLFEGRRVVLTPAADTDADALAQVIGLWQTAGASVHLLSAEKHDRVFAAVSHLPHLLSFALVEELAAREDGELLFSYAAGGFRDFTRIAASHPAMWRDISIANRDALLQELDAYIAAVTRMRDQVEHSDAQGLFESFNRAREARLRWGQGLA